MSTSNKSENISETSRLKKQRLRTKALFASFERRGGEGRGYEGRE